MVCEVPGRQGLLVEFHWSLVELPYFIDRIPMDEIWEAAQPCQDMPGEFAPRSGVAAPAQLRSPRSTTAAPCA